jgi:hypothetical protein
MIACKGIVKPSREADIKTKVKEFAYTLARYATVQLKSRDNITVMIILLVHAIVNDSEADNDIYSEDVDTNIVSRSGRGELDDGPPSTWLPVELHTSYSDEAF